MDQEKRTITIVFSKTGVTKKAARRVADLAGSDLMEIRTVKRYPESYAATVVVAKKEQLLGELPELKEYPDLAGYDRILLGFPVWWFTCPQAVAGFAAHYDLTGKTLLPFCTHGGGGPRSSSKKLREHCAAQVAECFDATKATDGDILRWLEAPKFA